MYVLPRVDVLLVLPGAHEKVLAPGPTDILLFLWLHITSTQCDTVQLLYM